VGSWGVGQTSIGDVHNSLEMAGAFRDFEAWNALARMAEVWLRLADDWDDASNRLRQSIKCPERPLL